MPKEITFKSHDLRLMETKDGVIVRQHGKEYLARKWQLNNHVEEIINLSVDAGFSCLWVDAHPSSHTAHYICFSRDHDKPWEFLIGGEAKPPTVKCITVNKKLRASLSVLSDDLIWQNFGGKHLFIEPTQEKLSWLLSLIKQIPRATLIEANSSRRLHRTTAQRVGFQLEKHLEDFVFEELKSRGHAPVRQPRAFKSNRKIESDSIPDIILDYNNKVFIVELKPNATDLADLYQLDRYANNKEIIAKYSSKIIKPVLLTGFFHEEIVLEAKKFHEDFELISYSYKDETVFFENILGNGDFYNLLTQPI
jgi:hypothetical protein